MGLWDTAPSFNNPPSFNDLESVQKYLKDNINKIARSLQEIDFVINGNMDSRNTREIGGYNVDLTELKSKNGTVGISSYNDPDPDVDDVRFWAGNADKNAAPWKVTEAGKMYATGAFISSSSGYPRIEMDPVNNIFIVRYDADNYATLSAAFGGAPAITFVSPFNTTVITSDSTEASIVTDGDLSIRSNAGDIKNYVSPGKSFVYDDFYTIYSNFDGTSLGAILQSLSDRITALGG